MEREKPVDGLLPEDAHRSKHDLVEVDKSALATVVVAAAVEERVSIQEGGLVVDEPERAGGGAQGQVVDGLSQDRRTFFFVGPVLKFGRKISMARCIIDPNAGRQQS